MILSEIDTTITTSYLGAEQDHLQALLAAQPAMTQRFLEGQAARLAEALADGAAQVKFSLPDRITMEAKPDEPGADQAVPVEAREQKVSGLRSHLERRDLGAELRMTLNVLEASPQPGLATSARLLRYATAWHMLHNLLPEGRPVKYIAPAGEGIPCLPVERREKASAILAASDSVVEEGEAEAGRGELQTPFVEAARRFFLPQWVAFDDQDRLLVNSPAEAMAYLASMQRYTQILHQAIALAPYLVADPEYQRKRYGILGQLVNQGRAMARYRTTEIIRTIQQRAADRNLNRGLSINLPYFDDLELHMAEIRLEVIPVGRIPFWSGFVVYAVRRKQAAVEQDTHLSLPTRRHLMAELRMLEKAFIKVKE